MKIFVPTQHSLVLVSLKFEKDELSKDVTAVSLVETDTLDGVSCT